MHACFWLSFDKSRENKFTVLNFRLGYTDELIYKKLIYNASYKMFR